MRTALRAALVLGSAASFGCQASWAHADVSGSPAGQGTGSAAAPTASQAGSIDAANAALAAGDYQQALKLLTPLRAANPKNPQVLYDLGLALEALHPDVAAEPEAEADYRAAIAANPLFPLPHVALGLMLARSARADEAREQFLTATKIPDLQPELRARALRAMARLDLNAHHPSDASGELAQALQLTPETPDDTMLLAEIAEATPDLDASENAYRRYLAGRANDPNATAALAHVLVAEHRPSEAETVLREALAAHPNDSALTSQLATTLLASGDDAKIAQAGPLLEKLHASRPEDTNVSRLLARLYVETGHPDKAEALYVKLTASGPADPALLDDYGEALLRLHRPAEAEKILKQAVANRAGFATSDDFADAAMHLAFAAQEIDDSREALRALELRGTVTPPSLPALFLEATARDALHQSSQAVDLYKRFLAEAHGSLPEQETKARERVAALGGRR
jgi:predicted Zn-dependent protease